MAWETEKTSGLLDDYDFAVDRAQFATDGRYNDGATLLLQWFGIATDSEGVQREHSVLISTGAGWESHDGGKTATHPTKTSFNARSHLGMIIDRCIDDFGLADTLSKRGNETEAKAWEGLRWHMNREQIDYGGDFGKKEKEMPTKFLGEISSTPSASSSGNGAVLLAKIKAEAKSAPSHNAFVDTVMDKYPEIADDTSLLEQVVDESGLYTQARG